MNNFIYDKYRFVIIFRQLPTFLTLLLANWHQEQLKHAYIAYITQYVGTNIHPRKIVDMMHVLGYYKTMLYVIIVEYLNPHKLY